MDDRYEYNRKTNALIERHAKQVQDLLAERDDARAALAAMDATIRECHMQSLHDGMQHQMDCEEIAKLKEERDALVRAAYEAAAEKSERRYELCERDNVGECQLRKCAIGRVIRGLTPFDALAALKRRDNALRAEGMRMALDLTVGTIMPTETRDRIRAAADALDAEHTKEESK